MKNLATLVAITLTAITTDAQGDDGPFQFEFQEIAAGVWAGVRPDGPRYPVMGNATFVISDEGVVVFDGGGMPVMAEQIIEKIRSLTDQPVTHVVISHWHGDHSFGVYRFAEEFSGVQFVAHQFTRDVFNSTRIAYIDRQHDFITNNLEEFQNIVDTGVDSEGTEQSESDRRDYQRIIEDADVITREFDRARVTPADVTFADSYTIQSGGRIIELLHLGHANTAGDIVMWLPAERIVATGDMVVLPSPYAFNTPPRAWAATLRKLNELDYATLVPGHGRIQNDTAYVDLLIEAADSIAAQRDKLLATGLSDKEVQEQLDFSAFEERFTHGDEYVKGYYDAYYETPFRAAAMKALTGEPMVKIEPPQHTPFDDERWEIEAEEYEIVEYLGQQALRLRGGAAMLPDQNIQNCLVEFDIAASDDRGFAGLMFRVQDDANFEHFYIRPHQSGKPDANQYTPVFNGVSGWQLYHGAGYSAPVEYSVDEWMHVKIIFAGSQAKVYIDSDQPVLHINDLKRSAQGGGIGLNSANFSAVHFANFKTTVLADAYAFPPATEANDAEIDGLVTSWQVSDAFDGATLAGITKLEAAHKDSRSWTQLSAEKSGITNLARVQGIGEATDTVFARVIVDSDGPVVRELSLGYSDVAAVFVNDALIYKGNNTYQSRDYRYLGTIGMFDRVTLPLQDGENEVWIAVSEAFGGWGILATITEFADLP